jgi:hypothetical protein
MRGVDTMGWFGPLMELLNKLWPSRKAQLVKKLSELNAEYQKALLEGRDTEAALIRKQLDELRKSAELTGGEV